MRGFLSKLTSKLYLKQPIILRYISAPPQCTLCLALWQNKCVCAPEQQSKIKRFCWNLAEVFEFESRHWCIFCLYSALWYQVFLSCRTPPLLLWFHSIPVELCSNGDPSVAWHVQLWNVYLCLCNKHNAHVNVLQSGGAKLWKSLHLFRNDSTFIFCMNELWPFVGKAFRVWENLWPQWTLHFDSN